MQNLNTCYGVFHAVKDVSLDIPGARVEGQVLPNGQNICTKSVDPVSARNTNGMVFQVPEPISTLNIADLKQNFTIVIVTRTMQQAARVSDMTAFCKLEKTGDYSAGRSS